ncbi:hypothetical protein EG327_009305 [Venturia inaequalis]|uniref:Uncharacterized protein n=1 Tax=Venturia inaequalis TaxID=5025 RepID=A0A8H3ZHN6_VENIN|nr:hypothetical protein EG327_009305 [Venturia inaequalis]
MAESAKDATGNAQIEKRSHTPTRPPSKGKLEQQQQPTPDETPKPKWSDEVESATAGAEKATEKESPQANRSKPRNNRRRGRNRSKASDTSYDSTAERAALSRPNRQPGKPKSERSQSNGVPISQTPANHKEGGSEAESPPETITGGRRNRQGNKQKQGRRVSKEENFEVGGVVNGRPLNGTEKERQQTNGTEKAVPQDKSDSESTAGSTGGRRNRRRRKGKKAQTNNAPLPNIVEVEPSAEREERPFPNGTGPIRESQIDDIGASQAGPSAIKKKEKVGAVKEEPLRLKLEFNMDIDVEIKAKVSGDLTLNMYGKAEFGELKFELDHAKFG